MGAPADVASCTLVDNPSADIRHRPLGACRDNHTTESYWRENEVRGCRQSRITALVAETDHASRVAASGGYAIRKERQTMTETAQGPWSEARHVRVADW